MRYLGPYVRGTDNRKFMVIVRDNGSKSTITYARYLMLSKVSDTNTVDHIDENRMNDAIDNLQVLSRAENCSKAAKFGAKGRKLERRLCGNCGKEIWREVRLRKTGLVFCSKSCNGKVNH